MLSDPSLYSLSQYEQTTGGEGVEAAGAEPEGVELAGVEPQGVELVGEVEARAWEGEELAAVVQAPAWTTGAGCTWLAGRCTLLGRVVSPL